MPLNSTKPARNDLYQNVQYISRNLTFADTGAKVIGVLPAGAIIIRPMSGVNVQVVANAGTANVIDIGTSDNDDLFGTDLSLLALGFIPLDEAVGQRMTADTTITATMGLTGTAATTGDVDVVICYVTPNDAA